MSIKKVCNKTTLYNFYVSCCFDYEMYKLHEIFASINRFNMFRNDQSRELINNVNNLQLFALNNQISVVSTICRDHISGDNTICVTVSLEIQYTTDIY